MKSSETMLCRWPFLDRAWTRKRLAQALLLVGAGEYAQDAAKAVVRRSLCEGDGKLDCACRSCQALDSEHPDLIVLSPSPKTIRLEPVQRAMSRVGIAPLWSPLVVVWVNPVTAMTLEAENSLLKSLEEPPGYVQYVLSVERVEGVLPTVRSRCQAVSVDDPHQPAKAFEKKWLREPDRDLANDLVAAGENVRQAFVKHPDPRLFTLFSVLWQARERIDRNHNLDLIREQVEIAWENAFGQSR